MSTSKFGKFNSTGKRRALPRQVAVKAISKPVMKAVEAKAERVDTADELYERIQAIHALEQGLVATQAQHMVLDLAMATATSLDFSRGQKPVWLVLEGNSGSGKTYTVELLDQYDGMIYRGKLTAAGMVSGYVDKAGKGVKGLFRELDKKCLVLTELGQTLSLNGNDLKALMGTFADVFDGISRNQVGTQDYQGDLRAHFAMLACGTPTTLSNHRSAMEPIGTRFLYFRLPDMTKDEVRERQRARKAITGRAQKEAEIRALVAEHLSSLPPVPDELPAWPDELDRMVEFLSSARAAVRRDEEGKPYAVDPEDPDRATHQLNCLGLALARLYGRREIDTRELDLLWQITLSSVPMERLLILWALTNGPLTKDQVATATNLSPSTAYRTLRVLRLAGLVDGDDANPCNYSLSAIFKTVVPKRAMETGFPVSQKTIISSSSSSSSVIPFFYEMEGRAS